MENTTMTTGIAPMSMPASIRIECSQPARFLAPVMGEVRGTTVSAAARIPAHAKRRGATALRGGTALGFATGYAPSVKDPITTPVITTTTFMDVDDIRSGRPPV